jgi:large subunit ribosomal protein L24e
MPTCSFCKRSFNAPRGITVFTLDGKALHFCKSKCRKNHKLGRDGRKVNWVRRPIKIGGKIVSIAKTTEVEETVATHKVEKVEEKK